MNKSLLIKTFRLFVMAFVLCFAVLGNNAAAQTSSRITVKMENATLETVINAIEQQSRYLFLNDQVDLSRKVSVNIENQTIEAALEQIFKGMDIDWKISGTNVYISNKNLGGAATDEVSGTVIDSYGNPIVGVGVIVKGTTVGTSTDLDGKFSFELPEGAEVLEFSSLGYKTVELAIGDRRVFDVTLEDDSIMMEGTVVTALGIKRSEKALNYNVQQLEGDALLEVKDANFVNSLNGRVAGVTINSGSSGIGGESKVVMRGTKGISQSSNALYVIDGIPMYAITGHGATDIGSRGRSESIADINPEDIESISVLTGAAAAALYGSNASNGAIVITTKSGKVGKTEVTVSSNTQVMSTFVTPKFQNRYGNLTDDVMSWGPKLVGRDRFGYDPIKDFLQTGIVATENVSLSTGNERNQAYISAGAVNSRGVVPNNGYNRYNFTFRNTTSFLKDRMHLDVGAQLILENDRNMVNQGQYSNPLVAAYLYPRGEDWEYAKIYEQYDPVRKIMLQNWPWMMQGGFVWDNPYWTAYRNIRENNKKRYMLNAGLTYDILDWLKVSGRIRIDNTYNKYTDKMYASTHKTLTEGSDNGYYELEQSEELQIYGDVLLSINKTFDDWSLNVNAGASFSDIRSDLVHVRGPIRNDGLPNVFNIFQLVDRQTVRRQDGWREQTQSVFASAEVGYKGAYFLTVTGRNDWPSQLAGPHSVKSSFFYPSVGGSVVISEIIPNMPRQLEYLKLRGSFASVGLPFARFIANPTYEWNQSSGAWEVSKIYPIYDLKPEKTNSWELGITMRFLKDFSLDLSYYNAKTFNQTFDSQLSVSSGYSKLYVQTGSVLNHGIELSLGFNHTWGKFTWDSGYTLSSNQNKILSLLENYEHPQTGEVITIDQLKVGNTNNSNLAFVLRKGGTLGDLYSTADLVRDANGNIAIGRDGTISSTTTEYRKLGSVFPKANMAWRNDFSIAGFNFGFMISARIGGIVYSATQANLDNFGVSEASAVARDNNGVMVEGCLIDAKNWYTVVGASNGIPQYYTYDATNIRLQDVHIGYTIPRSKLGDVLEMNISLTAKNLLMIYCKAPFDPENIASGGDYYQGIDYFMMPSLRSAGLNIRFKF